MNSEKLGNALAKSKDIAINLLGNILYRTRVEPIRDEDGIKGLKARWIGDPGGNVLEVSTPSVSADIKIEGDAAPTIEYVQEGEHRTVAVKHIKDISCEFSQETVDRIATPQRCSTCGLPRCGCRFVWMVSDLSGACCIRSTGSTDRRDNLSDCPRRR